MTRIKLCGLSRPEDIASANRVQPEFVGFVFVPGSKRYVSTRQAKRLKALLSPRIQAVGVFANAEPETVAGLLDRGVIDLAQLHGGESGDYIRRLRALTGKPIIQAFRITSAQDVMRAETSIADHILLDIRRMLNRHGSLATWVRGVHLHQSLSGAYVKTHTGFTTGGTAAGLYGAVWSELSTYPPD